MENSMSYEDRCIELILKYLDDWKRRRTQSIEKFVHKELEEQEDIVFDILIDLREVGFLTNDRENGKYVNRSL